MKLLLTSASSLLGFHLSKLFLKAGNVVHGTYRTYNDRISALDNFSQFTPIKINCSFSSKKVLLDNSYDVIINSTGAYPTCSNTSEDIIFANIKLPQIIKCYADTCKSLKTVINFSSLSVFGDLSKFAYIDATTPPSPGDIYGTTKLLSEQILGAAHSRDLAVFHLRFPVILCKGAHRAWLPTVLEKIKTDNVVTLINPDSLYSACTTVDRIYDFCNHLISLDSNSSPHPLVFPLGSIPDLDLRDMVSLMARFYSKSPLLSEIHNSSKCVYIDSSLAKQYGYQPLSTSQAIEYWLHQELSND